MVKNVLFFFALLISISGFSQSDIFFRIEHKMGSEPLVFEETYTEPTENYDFTITRLQYYISEISITHDGGQVTPIEETWLLVSAESQEDYSLGNQNITEVESISFHIGVDHAHNHLDPTLYPDGHPLALHTPAMHWGWAAGYRFACLEGKTGTNLLFTYQIHALGDNNYYQTNIPTASIQEGDNQVIVIKADYFGLYDGVDVSAGVILHSDNGLPATMLENFSQDIYSQILFTGTEEHNAKNTFSIAPNPCYNLSTTIQFNLQDSQAHEVKVFDLTGRIVLQEQVADNSSVNVTLPDNGMYLVQLWEGGAAIQTKKLIVAR